MVGSAFRVYFKGFLFRVSSQLRSTDQDETAWIAPRQLSSTVCSFCASCRALVLVLYVFYGFVILVR